MSETLKSRLLNLMKELNRNGVTAAGELKEAIHGLAENAGKKGD